MSMAAVVSNGVNADSVQDNVNFLTQSSSISSPSYIPQSYFNRTSKNYCFL